MAAYDLRPSVRLVLTRFYSAHPIVFVQGEAASIFPFIHEKLLKGPTLPILSSLVTAVLERKHLEAPSLATSAAAVPGRVLPVATGTSPWQQDRPVIIPNPG